MCKSLLIFINSKLEGGKYLKDTVHIKAKCIILTIIKVMKTVKRAIKNKIMKMAFRNPLAKCDDASEARESILNVSKDLCI